MRNLYLHARQRAVFGRFSVFPCNVYAKMFYGYDILKHECGAFGMNN